MKPVFRIAHWFPCYNEQITTHAMVQTHRDHISITKTGNEYSLWATHSCDLVWSRSNALDRALNEGYDWLCMQDADVYSPADIGPVAPLLSTAIETKATVAGAMVSMRTVPPRANVWPCHPGRVYQADKIGTGLILIDLNRIRGWYDEYDGPCFQRTYKTAKCVVQDVGQDIFFSYVVREHGGLIVCDARIPTVHVDACHRHEYDGATAPGLSDVAEPTDTESAEPDAEPSRALSGVTP